ncbi:hypothetical protein J1614_003134 [Plenodomus biglobosus]|nr:hypothetical protein J1614_003134 [Plenodomus biglobosus]
MAASPIGDQTSPRLHGPSFCAMAPQASAKHRSKSKLMSGFSKQVASGEQSASNCEEPLDSTVALRLNYPCNARAKQPKPLSLPFYLGTFTPIASLCPQAVTCYTYIRTSAPPIVPPSICERDKWSDDSSYIERIEPPQTSLSANASLPLIDPLRHKPYTAYWERRLGAPDHTCIKPRLDLSPPAADTPDSAIPAPLSCLPSVHSLPRPPVPRPPFYLDLRQNGPDGEIPIVLG